MNETLYIVDGSAYIYRAFFAIRNLSNSKGEPTNAIYGFIQMLRKLLEQENPDYLAMTFDPFGHPEPGFRWELYPEYKANRDEMPGDLRSQIPWFQEFVEAMSIPVLVVPGMEADDLIATLTKKALLEDLKICIVSADKDLMQLLGDPRVRMIDTMRDKVFTEVDVIERFGVTPDKVKYVMALSGDTSDNVPGVPGIGEKTGGKLVAEFGDLETVLASVDKISGTKRKENLINFADQARLSLALVTLKDDCDIPLDLDALRMSAPDVPALTELMTRLEFKNPLRDIQSWMKKKGFIEGHAPPVMPEPERMASKVAKGYRMVTTEADLAEVVRAIRRAGRLAVDLETTAIDPLDAVIVGVALSWEPHTGVYIPTSHRYIGAPKQLSTEYVMEALRSLLEDPDFPKIAQNYKYEWIVFGRHGITLRGIEWDTMLMSYLLDPGKLSHGLDAIAADYLRHETIKYSDVTGTGKNKINFEMVDVEQATQYAAEDADITLLICDKLAPTIDEAGLRNIHDEMELPLSIILARMESAGISIDTSVLKILGAEFGEHLEKLHAQINEIAGQPLNPNSPLQLREVLFEKLGLPIKKRTRTGPSTDQSVLEQLSELHELPALILEYRSFSKLKGTYVDALPELVRADTGRIHTDFNQAVTATGRLSSSNPNLQNIPVRSDYGREIRRAFVPAKGKKLICADYSQIELRIMAHMSGDPELVEAYKTGQDIHSLTASKIFGIELADVTSDQRRAGKTVNFGVMYGMGANRLARDLKISRKEAKQYIENYFERYSVVKTFFDQLQHEARDKGYAETLFGRRRLLAKIDGFGGAQRAFEERVAVNMPIQGTAADIIKKAMLNIQERIDTEKIPAVMLLQVHDELIFEVDEDIATEFAEVVREVMASVVTLDVPLEVDVGIGDNWMDAK
jgi:DNA polymerase-1